MFTYSNHPYNWSRWWHSHRHPHGTRFATQSTKWNIANSTKLNSSQQTSKRQSPNIRGAPVATSLPPLSTKWEIQWYLATDIKSLMGSLESAPPPPLCLAQIMSQTQWMQISVVPGVQPTCYTQESQYHPG